MNIYTDIRWAQIPRSIRMAAALWYVETDGSVLPDDRTRQFQAWLHADRRHAYAYTWVKIANDAIKSARGRPIPRLQMRGEILMDITTHILEQVCPCCSHNLTDATGGRKPYAGAYAVCIKCRSVLRFGKDLVLVSLTETDIAALEPDLRAELSRVQCAARAVAREH